MIKDVHDFAAFKHRFGRPTGDFAGWNVGEVVRRCARNTDIVAHCGGGELTMIPNETMPKGASMVAERIKLEMAAIDFAQNSSISVQLAVSIRVPISERGGNPEDQTVSFANETAYRGRVEGKDREMVRVRV